MYQGLFNSSYAPTHRELAYINDPVNMLGPWFCSVVFSLLLNGIILAQTYNYAEQQNKDPRPLRYLVYSTFLLCTAKSADTFSITFGDYSGVRTSC
ncbi:hypothetical protein FRC08_013154 [Ceratobasidium sp. 394]|nr:hypothetical protein FRC08_013154 [Ceratobasidium sp. 394]